jgi:predicted transcriptional regulator
MAKDEDDLEELIQKRNEAQAALNDALDEIENVKQKATEADRAVKAVNRKIAVALGIPMGAEGGRTNHERVLVVLKAAKGPMKRREIAEELDAEPNSVGNALKYLKDQGLATQTGSRSGATWTAA